MTSWSGGQAAGVALQANRDVTDAVATCRALAAAAFSVQGVLARRRALPAGQASRMPGRRHGDRPCHRLWQPPMTVAPPGPPPPARYGTHPGRVNAASGCPRPTRSCRTGETTTTWVLQWCLACAACAASRVRSSACTPAIGDLPGQLLRSRASLERRRGRPWPPWSSRCRRRSRSMPPGYPFVRCRRRPPGRPPPGRATALIPPPAAASRRWPRPCRYCVPRRPRTREAEPGVAAWAPVITASGRASRRGNHGHPWTPRSGVPLDPLPSARRPRETNAVSAPLSVPVIAVPRAGPPFICPALK